MSSLDPFEGWEVVEPPGMGKREVGPRATLDRRGHLTVNKALAAKMALPPLGAYVIVYVNRTAQRVGLRIVPERRPRTLRLSPKHSSGRLDCYMVGLGPTLVRAGWNRDRTIPADEKSIRLTPRYDERTGLWWFQLPAGSFHAVPNTAGIRSRLRRVREHDAGESVDAVA